MTHNIKNYAVKQTFKCATNSKKENHVNLSWLSFYIEVENYTMTETRIEKG